MRSGTRAPKWLRVFVSAITVVDLECSQALVRSSRVRKKTLQESVLRKEWQQWSEQIDRPIEVYQNVPPSSAGWWKKVLENLLFHHVNRVWKETIVSDRREGVRRCLSAHDLTCLLGGHFSILTPTIGAFDWAYRWGVLGRHAPVVFSFRLGWLA